MNHDEHPVMTLAGLHAAINDQSLQLGRLDERMASLQRDLTHHTREEHKEFREALDRVAALQASVAEIHAGLRVLRWIGVAVAGAAAAVAWALDHVRLQ